MEFRKANFKNAHWPFFLGKVPDFEVYGFVRKTQFQKMCNCNFSFDLLISVKKWKEVCLNLKYPLLQYNCIDAILAINRQSIVVLRYSRHPENLGWKHKVYFESFPLGRLIAHHKHQIGAHHSDNNKARALIYQNEHRGRRQGWYQKGESLFWSTEKMGKWPGLFDALTLY